MADVVPQTPAPVPPSPAPTVPAQAAQSVAPTPAAPAAGAFPAPQGDDIQTIDTPMSGKYKVFVHRKKCISAGSCIAIAPKVFQFDQENIAHVQTQDELDDLKLLAAQSCPVLAIVVQDMETGKIVWPEGQA